MPHVLWELQGMQTLVNADELAEHPGSTPEFALNQPGSMSAEEYDQAARDLTNFMVYIAEPVQVERRSMGWKVLLFLIVFFGFAYALKKEYWKDVH